MLPKMNRRVITLTVLCLLLVSLSGCHLIGSTQKSWSVHPEVRNTTATEDEYVFEMGFDFGGHDDPPVRLEDVKLVFVGSEGSRLNETFMGTIEFRHREYESFNVSLPRRPEYVQLKYTSLNYSDNADKAIRGLRYSEVSRSNYTTYDDYDAKYERTDS